MKARKSYEIQEPEWKSQFELIFKSFQNKKGNFYKVKVKANKFEEWHKFMIQNCSNFHIFSVDTIDANVTFEIYLHTDHDFTKRDSKLFTYRFILLWHRELSDVPHMAIETISGNDLMKLRQTIGDTGKTPQMRFICRIERTIFFTLNSVVWIYDLDTCIARKYSDSVQADLFETSLMDKFTFEFYEKFL